MRRKLPRMILPKKKFSRSFWNIILYILAASFLSFCSLQQAEKFAFGGEANRIETQARLLRVNDGDTFTARVQGEEWRVRLLGIDAPESKQDFGRESKDALEEMLKGKLLLECDSQKDKYQRWVCDVYANGVWVNQKMVEDGFAWHYAFYSNKLSLKEAEKKARQNKKGLWQQENPQNPRDWRKNHPR